MASVPSVEPSSTSTRVKWGCDWASRESIASARYAARLWSVIPIATGLGAPGAGLTKKSSRSPSTVP